MLEQAELSIQLTDDEKKMFERLIAMEAVHNELAFALSAYKENIIRLRNEFVLRVTRKYGITNPAHVTYDPLTQKIVSVFHPELRGHKIERRPHAFRQVASELLIEAIKKLSEIYGATK